MAQRQASGGASGRDRVPGEQSGDEPSEGQGAVLKARHPLGDTDAEGAPAAEVATAIGAQDTLANGGQAPAVVFLKDTAVGDEVLGAATGGAREFMAVEVEVAGEAIEGLEGGKETAHVEGSENASLPKHRHT